MAMFAERILRRDAGAASRRACGCASSAAARASRPSCVEQMEWAEEQTAANDAHHAVRRLQLRRPGGDRRRRARASTGDDRGGVPRAPVRARDARPRPAHPHERRAAARRTSCCGSAPTPSFVFTRRAVAGLHARRPRGRARRVRRAQAPLRGPLMADAPPPAARRRDAAPRRPRTSRAAILVAIPAVAFAIGSSSSAGRRSRSACSLLGGSSACTSCTRCSSACGPVRLAGLPRRSPGFVAGARTTATSPRGAAGVGRVPPGAVRAHAREPACASG